MRVLWENNNNKTKKRINNINRRDELTESDKRLESLTVVSSKSYI